jgi:IS30 family transposase
VLVLHERKSRVTLAARLTGKTAAETISAMLTVFGRVDPHLRRSITFDNDTAFAEHGLLRTMRDMTIWFCDAYHGKKAASKTPMDAYADGCHATSISTGHPTGKARSPHDQPHAR